LAIVGKGTINVLRGSIEINGYTLVEEKIIKIYSPSFDNALTVRSKEKVTIMKVTFEKHEFYKLYSLGDMENHTKIDTSWKMAADNILKDYLKKGHERILICGTKHVGKSTFLRYVVNRILSVDNEVSILDCDVEKPEMGPPGLLNLSSMKYPLLSPPYTRFACNKLEASPYLHRAAFYGYTRLKDDPCKYISCVSSLIDYWNSFEEEKTLIIHTNGYVKTIGNQMLLDLIDIVDPTHVIKFQGLQKEQIFSLDITQKAHIVSVHSKLRKQKPESNNRKTKLLSSNSSYLLTLSSYFLTSQTDDIMSLFLRNNVKFNASKNETIMKDEFYFIARTLASMKPYAVSFNAISFQLDKKQNNDFMLDVLNGSFIGLLVHNNNHEYCVGLGIVRSI